MSEKNNIFSLKKNYLQKSLRTSEGKNSKTEQNKTQKLKQNDTTAWAEFDAIRGFFCYMKMNQ